MVQRERVDADSVTFGNVAVDATKAKFLELKESLVFFVINQRHIKDTFVVRLQKKA